MSAIIFHALHAPFRMSELEHRPQGKPTSKGSLQVLTYVQRKAVIDRLNQAVGHDGWRDTYQTWGGDDKSAKCRLSLRFDDNSEWLWREDVSDPSDIEAVKGGVTGAFKRAASKWGIGLYLYDFPTIYLPAQENGGKFYLPRDADQQVLQILRKRSPALLHPDDGGSGSLPPDEGRARQQQAAPAPQPAAPIGRPVPATAEPSWFREPVRLGKYKDSTWEYFTEESESGGRIQYLEWLIREEGNSQMKMRATLVYMFIYLQRWYEEILSNNEPITSIDVVSAISARKAKKEAAQQK